MADMTIIQEIAFLKGLPKKIGETGKQIMKEEFNHKDRPYATGKTAKSFHYEIMGDSIFIGSDTEGAKWVQKGRGPVTPKTKPYIAFQLGVPGSDAPWIRTKYARKVEADDYLGRTVKKLKSMDFH